MPDQNRIVKAARDAGIRLRLEDAHRSQENQVATLRSLTGISREGEIARMLGGERITAKTRSAAAELIAGTQ